MPLCEENKQTGNLRQSCHPMQTYLHTPGWKQTETISTDPRIDKRIPDGIHCYDLICPLHNCVGEMRYDEQRDEITVLSDAELPDALLPVLPATTIGKGPGGITAHFANPLRAT